MDGKMLARLAAVVFIAIAVTATAIDMARKDEPSAPPPAPAFQPPTDPLRETLRRCQQLGEAAGVPRGATASGGRKPPLGRRWSVGRLCGRPSTEAGFRPLKYLSPRCCGAPRPCPIGFLPI